MIDNIFVDFDEFLVNCVYRVVNVSKTNFEKTLTNTDTTIKAAIQPTNADNINKDIVDWSLSYVLIHTKEKLELGQTLIYNISYKIIEAHDWNDYGYYQYVGEQIK